MAGNDEKDSWLKLTEDLGDFERLLLRQKRAKRLFAVISWGCAATVWVSRVLDSHPDILCLHAGNSSLKRYGYPEQDKLDGVPYLRLIAALAGSYPVAGDVHGVSRHHVPALQETFGDSFRCAVLVRDPLPRIRSQMALFETFRRFDPWNLEYTDGLIETHGITVPPDQRRSRMFVHAANMLNAIVEEREVGPVFRTMDITSEPEALAEFVTTLTGGELGLDREWLNQAIGQPRINCHNVGRREAGPARGHSSDAGSHRGDSSHELSAWEIDVLRKIVRPEAWDAYAELGYTRPAFLDEEQAATHC